MTLGKGFIIDKLRLIWTIGPTYGLDQGPYSEEEGGERWAPNKAGPKRPPLLNGIKWELLWTIEKYY